MLLPVFIVNKMPARPGIYILNPASDGGAGSNFFHVSIFLPMGTAHKAIFVTHYKQPITLWQKQKLLEVNFWNSSGRFRWLPDDPTPTEICIR